MRIKSIFNSSVGNILEWYDFGLFAIYSETFSHLFFPSSHPGTALIATLTVFAIGFICRPIGAIVFGIMGDREGRVKTLRLSILMISLPTLLIGFLPTFASIGIIAPILLMLTRIWQGISIGGEYSGNMIYLAESAPADYRGTITAFAATGANIGILLATVVGALSHYFFTEHTFQEWGWRIPYLLSGIISLIIYRTRLHMTETPVFEQLKQQHRLPAHPLTIVLQKNLPQVLLMIGLVCMGTTFYYFSFVYIPLYLAENHFSFTQVSVLMTFLFLSMIILVPLSGRLCDKIGRRKMMLFNAALIALIIVPGLYVIQMHHTVLIIFILMLFVVASSLEQGTTLITTVENFPAPARYTGLSLGYNLGNGILGGTVPLISQFLLTKTHFSLMPAIYVAFCAAITGIVSWFFVKETRYSKL